MADNNNVNKENIRPKNSESGHTDRDSLELNSGWLSSRPKKRPHSENEGISKRHCCGEYIEVQIRIFMPVQVLTLIHHFLYSGTLMTAEM